MDLALRNLKAAPAVTIVGVACIDNRDQVLSFRRCGSRYQATIAEPGHGSVTMIAAEDAVWVKIGADFLLFCYGDRARQDEPSSGARYVKYSDPGSFGDLSGTGVVTAMTGPPRVFTKSPPETIGHQRVIRLTSRSRDTTAWVSDTSAPRLLEVRSLRPGCMGSLTITHGTPAAITAPAASQTIDGSAYGF